MNYYCIEYLYSEEKHGVYSHLPATSQVTTDKAVADRWYEDAKRAHLESWRGNELVFEKERKLDYMCYLRELCYKCNEAGYRKGFYLMQLACYSHNPVA